MRLGNVDGRPMIARADGYVDVTTASGGRFDTYDAVLDDWAAFRDWATLLAPDTRPDAGLDVTLGPAIPRPRLIVGVGFNYATHRAEMADIAGLDTANDGDRPPLPLFFTKLPSAVTGPTGDVVLQPSGTDFEVELVAVIGTAASQVRPADAWRHLAGLTVGQDISAREIQFANPPQHMVAKSFPTFAPLGPHLVTPDELSDPTGLHISCTVNGEQRQRASTRDLIFSVAELVSLLSAVTTLQPGDLIFTGTPAGVGGKETPPRYLQPGDVIVSEIEGIGRLENRCVAGPPATEASLLWQR